MFIYNGCKCAICGENFDKASDVVVCPECGTPTHRSCWKELSHCPNEEKHADGFIWQAPEKILTKGMDACPKCHAENPPDAVFCEGCGIALSKKQGSSTPSLADFKNQQGGAADTSIIIPKALEGEQDGVSFKDMAIYIGATSPYYVFKFKRMQRELKAYKPFCWSAFLFGPLYFLYRKMWFMGIITGLTNLIINFPSAVLFAVQQGVITANSPLMFAGIENVAYFLNILLFIATVVWGFMAIPLFQKKVIKDLKHIKSSLPNPKDYYEAIVKKSGPSKIVLLASLSFTLYYLLF